jgi:DNA protecting protein DprA
MNQTNKEREKLGKRHSSSKGFQELTEREAAEMRLGITIQELADLYVLESIRGFGPQKFKEIHQKRVTASDVLKDPELLPITGKRGAAFQTALRSITDETRLKRHEWAIHQIWTAHRLNAHILTYDHPAYPKNVYESNNPSPILYVRGNLQLFNSREVVACVGSRKIADPYSKLHEDFSKSAVGLGFTIVSGFALGADSIGHRTAFESMGQTICVMPCGLDRPFPPENRSLWDRFLESRTAMFVSEYPFGRRAAALTLRKRNKLIVAFAEGVLVSQSSDKGGAMNAYRFAREQRKPVATFVENGMPDTSGNKLIAQERLLTDAVFPIQSNPAAFESWLQQLSSSI